ncbi:MAG: nucleotidyl transferase AbiEii/AbiGii toxin family protein [Bacteroidetes bacterium]|nr:nucleotidyl transferase AbiEii/AbiGii toxin family protein [Bacteroidota bacterium]
MRLHENKTLFRQAVQFAADQMRIPSIYVEKDYWVTYALFTIFRNKIGNETVFKGGTALSKCFNIIDRFSEDIDLVVLRREGESNNRLTTKIRTISEVVNSVLPEVTIDGLTQKMEMNRKTAHSYNREFEGNFADVRDVIVVEATWLGCHEPYTTTSIISFVGQMMLDNRQRDIAIANGLLSFDLRVLEPTRTICEKVMSLVRFSYSEDPIGDLNKKIRHTYDLHQILRQELFLKFFHSAAFDEMLLKVANDDVVSFKNNNMWLVHHPCDALIFRDLVNVWDKMRATYNASFRNLVYGELPREEEVLKTLEMIQERLRAVSWSVEI